MAQKLQSATKGRNKIEHEQYDHFYKKNMKGYRYILHLQNYGLGTRPPSRADQGPIKTSYDFSQDYLKLDHTFIVSSRLTGNILYSLILLTIIVSYKVITKGDHGTS